MLQVESYCFCRRPVYQQCPRISTINICNLALRPPPDRLSTKSKGSEEERKARLQVGVVWAGAAVHLRVFIRTPLSEWSIVDRKRVETRRTEADAAYQFRQDTDVIASLSGWLAMTLLDGGLGNLSSLALVGFYLIGI